MSLHIYIAHTGERYLADPISLTSPDALRTWITRNTSIPSQRQILMTARGKNVKAQTLATESEIFVYDRRYVNEPNTFELPELPPPQPLTLDNPPDTLTNQNDLQAWKALYSARRDWASNLTERCAVVDKQIQDHNERTDIINRAAGVALENLKAHVGTLEHRFQEAQTWANGFLKDQHAVLDGWRKSLASLDNIPARKDFNFLGRPSTPTTSDDRLMGTLRNYVDVEEVQRAGSEAPEELSRFAQEISKIEESVGQIAADTQRLVDDAFPTSLDGVDGLLQEVETISKKIQSDYEHVLALSNNQKALANISRLALSHTKDLLPSLLDISSEIQAGLEEAVNRYNSATKAASGHMRLISSIESRLADVQTQINNLNFRSDAFDTIYSVFHMPMIYGSVLIEAARRREFSEKMKTDSLTLAEEMSVFREEEQRRRKKWMKTMGEFLSTSDTSTPGIEVNLRGQEYEWPAVSRKEIESYIEELKTKTGMTQLAQELSELYKELDAPTRLQRRRSKAFKQGSLFDLSRSSLVLRSDDMVRSLRDEKGKLEERLKGSESRIRKLEDLLHRQSHMSRPSSGNFSLDFPSSPASPHPDALSRRSSVSSRRMSSNQPPEEKALVQRIVHLEAELAAKRETVQRLQKEAHAERQSNTDKIQEEQSTKKDLIGNLEARQREFDDERRYLEGELKRLKIRNEELEEELDRNLDSREHEKHDTDERIHQLEAELQDAHARAEEESRKATELSKQMETDQDAARDLELRLTELQNIITDNEKLERETLNSLQSAFMNLSPGSSVPAKALDIVKAIEVLSEGLSIHAKNAEENALKAAAEYKEVEERLSQLETDAEDMRKVADAREADLSLAREELAQGKSKLEVVTSELEGERSKLITLQMQFAAGENGSDALRKRVTQEERKLTNLSQRLAEVETLARQSEEEVTTWRKKVEAISEAEQRATVRSETCVLRSQQLSRQLFAQVEKLEHMLEQLGFTIIRQDGNIVVQRSSKVNAMSVTGESLSHSEVVSVKPDASLLTWMHAETKEEETDRFMAFMECLYQFDVEIFGDAVVKRVKDIESLARKWQKEARGYRDKYHRVQSEAHDKIAYRSFKEGDLALFLPTRNQAIRSWAAFNVGAPHYFLREQDVHKLQARDWLLARITKIEERVVDLSKSLNGANPDRQSIGEVSDGTSFDDENPFELSDGLRWYLLDATEEKPGAPATPGLGKSTVASAHVDAKGSIRLKRTSVGGNVAKTLSKSLDSRRDSSNSKKAPSTPSQRGNESAVDLARQAEEDPTAVAARSRPREAPSNADEGAGHIPENSWRQQPPLIAGANRSSSSSMRLEDVDVSSINTPASRRTSRYRPWVWSVDYRLEGNS
ncbi:autophagy protein ATG11 [Aspergillus saccharolyticus JOP 1030-1]|uniref:Autophagy-related protein 11 n=1 Tax=Aspergillus saccharolyticus JOP 1030-1 TaxID=1450539 RepID=A0A318ZZC6_9EURO|nr:autophagy-related protein 11 [Aspergillus saccharolyticus JOP 1030-1]PYH45438.1 autophagy-related protein 11 [Aspergillus saccharolyticus JOP 1030-1]